MTDYEVVERRGVWQWCRKVGSVVKWWSDDMYDTEEEANAALDDYLASGQAEEDHDEE